MQDKHEDVEFLHFYKKYVDKWFLLTSILQKVGQNLYMYNGI